MREVNTIVVHYSATYPEQDITWSDIDAMHRERGFNGGGYHWFIRRNGMIEKGRDENIIGAHVKGHNRDTIGVCFAGGIDHKTGANIGVWNPTPEQEVSLVSLIQDIQKRYPKATNVVGHRNLAATQCPGRDDVASWFLEKTKSRASKGKPNLIDLIMSIIKGWIK